jgi:hypothetical protein
METDWEFEIGGDAPVIAPYWRGFVDLRAHPERAAEISECGELPGLANALVRLNAANSPVWTSKTDVFIPEQVDADEMDASVHEVAYAIACYIDLLQRTDRPWNDPAQAEQACRELCAGLRQKQLECCRIDIVVRKAAEADNNKLGATVYLTACGPTFIEAKDRLGKCLDVFAEAAVVSR